MDAIGTFLGLAVFVAVAAFVVRPLLVGPSASSRDRYRAGGRGALARQMDERAELLEKRNAVYTAIRELDFDHETGKVSDEDHARQRAELVREGVAILKGLDRLEATAPAADSLEAAIAAMRQGEDVGADVAGLSVAPTANGYHACPSCGTPASSTDRFCGTCGQSLEFTCAECGTPHQSGDLFCAHCGAALEAQR
jgi:hypothetical protein